MQTFTKTAISKAKEIEAIKVEIDEKKKEEEAVKSPMLKISSAFSKALKDGLSSRINKTTLSVKEEITTM